MLEIFLLPVGKLSFAHNLIPRNMKTGSFILPRGKAHSDSMLKTDLLFVL